MALHKKMVAVRALSKMSPQPLVACNVYVSSGRPQHADLLLRLLSNAQVSESMKCAPPP